MIAALIIGNILMGYLICGGFPLWCEIAFSVISVACISTAVISWEMAKDEIKRLRRQINRMEGGK